MHVDIVADIRLLYWEHQVYRAYDPGDVIIGMRVSGDVIIGMRVEA